MTSQKSQRDERVERKTKKDNEYNMHPCHDGWILFWGVFVCAVPLLLLLHQRSSRPKQTQRRRRHIVIAASMGVGVCGSDRVYICLNIVKKRRRRGATSVRARHRTLDDFKNPRDSTFVFTEALLWSHTSYTKLNIHIYL